MFDTPADSCDNSDMIDKETYASWLEGIVCAEWMCSPDWLRARFLQDFADKAVANHDSSPRTSE